MKTITYLIKPLMKIPIVLQAFATKKGLIMAPVAVLPVVISTIETLKLLLALMVLDFFTGIWASYVEKKSEEKNNPELRNRSLISSDKLKLSGVKFMLYAATILLAHGVEQTFFIRSFEITFSSAHFTLTVAVISFWIIVEFYSVVFENFKRMGFDVFEKLKQIVSKFKSTKNLMKS